MAGSNGGRPENGTHGARAVDLMEAAGARPPEIVLPQEPEMKTSNRLTDLGLRIFLDRYAQKDPTKETLGPGDRVLVVANRDTGQRELGVVESLHGTEVRVLLEDGQVLVRPRDAVDKPLETAPEQAMDRVAHGIASVEAPEVQEQWQQEFRWLLDGFKFVPGGRILAAAGTEQQLTYYNCMPPDQEILTEDGYKPIAEVQVGDLVVTHRNRLRTVLHKLERETQEPLYTIRPRKLGYDDLRVTGEHKVLAFRSEWVDQKHRSRDGLRLHEPPQWIPAKDLKPGDFLAAAYDGDERPIQFLRVSDFVSGYETANGQLYKPLKRSEHHGYLEAGGTHHAVNDEIEVDSDLCYLFGRWLGDGCVTHRTKTSIPSGIKIVFALDEQPEGERLGRIITEKFGVPTSLKLSSTGRWYDLWANSLPLGELFKALFGAYSYGKRIPASIMHLPKQLTLELLKGLFGADGYVSSNKIGIVLSNRALATQVHQLLMKLGYFFSIKENTHRLGRHRAYRVSATANVCEPLFKEFFDVLAPEAGMDVRHYLDHDGLRWIRIDEIRVESYSGTVLDIEVEEDHSFVSAGVVISNCYVIPSPQDSRTGIVTTLSQMMEIMSRGGGVGINVSTLRPRYAYVAGVNGRSSGSVSWGALYSFVTGLIEQGGSRRGALMLILGCWHPDVEEFIRAKTVMGRITNANISVAVTDAFMEAVHDDADWNLEFPDTTFPEYEALWDGNLDAWKKAGRPVKAYRTVKARELWNMIVQSAWASAEPGLYFIDRANKASNSWYYPEGYLLCTNPCGEQPLSSFAVCNLGALNLARFAEDGKVYWSELSRAVRAAVRFLDNVIDATPYFLEENHQQQMSERRVGLGVMGLAEMLIRMRVRYGSEKSLELIDTLFEFIAHEAYLASADIAAEKGSFPRFEAEPFLQSGFMQSMPEDVREAVREKGIRNVTLLTVAPTGTTGTMVNTSTGIEPFFFWSFMRNSRLGKHEERVAVAAEWQEAHPGQPLPEWFVTAMDLPPEAHVRVQAAVQRWIDSAISKTSNVPEHYTVEEVGQLYELMYDLGSKGGTVYRDGSRDTQVLELKAADKKPAVLAAAAPQPPMPKVRPRPYKRHGVTVSVPTPAGTSHITMNDDDAGLPFEIFLEIGKAGSDLKAMAEAMGRLMSLVLRIASPLTPAERIEQIVTQLSGIGGARTLGFGKNRVLSFPDAVANALAEHYGIRAGNGTANGYDEPESGEPAGPKQLTLPAIMSGDLCPECGNSTFVREAGCVRCYACGHSEC
jgi:ribonucleoside-diphosphate reductase alpha chain